MQYEYLFVDRKRIGSNIEAIMKDRKCTKVTLSQAMNISRPTLDAFLRGDIHNAGKYDEYIRRLLVYMQVSDTVLNNYKSLPDVKKMRCNSIQKDEVQKGIRGKQLMLVSDMSYRAAYNTCKKLAEDGEEGFVISYQVPDATKILGEMTEAYPDLYIGVADIMNKEDASLAADSGARFMVTNYVIKEVGSFCKDRDIFCAMGAMTLTEVNDALNYGSDAVNLYPFEEISQPLFKAIRNAFPDAVLMTIADKKGTVKQQEDLFALLVR